MDTLKLIYEWWLAAVGKMCQPVFFTVVRGAIALAIPTAICGFCFFRLKCRLMAVQWAACLFGLLVAMEIPLERIPLGRLAKGWVFAFSLVLLAVLPWQLAWLLAKKDGHRKVLAATLYFILIVLLISSLWRN